MRALPRKGQLSRCKPKAHLEQGQVKGVRELGSPDKILTVDSKRHRLRSALRPAGRTKRCLRPRSPHPRGVPQSVHGGLRVIGPFPACLAPGRAAAITSGRHAHARAELRRRLHRPQGRLDARRVVHRPQDQLWRRRGARFPAALAPDRQHHRRAPRPRPPPPLLPPLFTTRAGLSWNTS